METKGPDNQGPSGNEAGRSSPAEQTNPITSHRPARHVPLRPPKRYPSRQHTNPADLPPQTSPSEEPLPYEEAIALINEKHEYPQGAEELIGKENLEAIRAILYDKELGEAETLLLCGNMTPEEFRQYIVQIDGLRKLRIKTFEVADKITEYIVDHHQEEIGLIKMPQEQQEQQELQKPQGIATYTRKLLNKIKELNLLKKESPRKPEPIEEPRKPEPIASLLKLFGDISETISSQAIGEVEGGRRSHRGFLINSITNSIYGLLSIIAMQRANCMHERQNYSNEQRERIKETICRMNEIWMRMGGTPFPGAISVSGRSNVIEVIWENLKHRKRFYCHLFGTNNLNQIPREQDETLVRSLTEETDKLFAEINDLSCFRKINPHIRKMGGMEIHLDESAKSKSGVHEINRALNVCSIRIVLDPSVPVDPSEPHRYNKTSFEVRLDRATGELNLIGTSLPLHAMMRKDAYLLLKKNIFKFILEHLEKKEDDIPDLFKKEEPPDDSPIGTVAIVGKTRSAVHKSIHHQVKPPTRVYEDANTNEPKEEPATLAQEVETHREAYKKLRGLPAEIILRAATSILGSPMRVSGSHYVFRGKEGSTCVIPCGHGSTSINKWTLKEFLKHAGISPKEFADRI